MNLSMQHYGSVVNALRRVAEDGSSDKRQHTRMHVQAKILVAQLQESRVTRVSSALTQDISFGGIGLLHYSLVERGHLFIARLPCDAGEVHLVCRAVFSKAIAEGFFAVGAEFQDEAAPELVEQLVRFEQTEMDRIRQSILN